MHHRFWLVFGILVILCGSKPAFSQTLFEGYAKITHMNQHIGFVIYRFGYDSKKKEFSGIYFMRTNVGGISRTESLTTISDDKIHPKHFVFNQLEEPNTKAKTIEGDFKKGVYTQTIREGGKANVKKFEAPPDAFFSFMMIYRILNSPKGLRVGEKYLVKAYAEEDGGLYNGDAYVQKEEKVLGIDCLKVLINFKGTQYVNFVTNKGDIIKYVSPNDGVITELVKDPTEATGTIKYSTSALTLLFGNVPTGKVNPLTGTQQEEKLKALNSPPPAKKVDTPKKDGVPPGQGLILKPTEEEKGK